MRGHVDPGNPDSITAYFMAYCSGTLQPTNVTDCLITEAKETLKLGVYAGNNMYKLSFRFIVEKVSQSIVTSG